MRPRQPFPARGGMPQPMPGFGRSHMRPMMNPTRMGNMGFGNMGMTRSPIGANAARGTRRPTRNNGGGLLAKLLRKGNNQGAQPGGLMFGNPGRSTAQATSGGLLKSLTDPTAITGFLNNTQRVLNTAQQIGPFVQQYGPIVKNLPAMWKLYRGLNAASAEDENTEDLDVESVKPKQKSETKNSRKRSKSMNTETETEAEGSLIEIDEIIPKNLKGKSVPKIYV
jgi:hypothetical protein